ncbi:unnamed protein product [Didymodactylos carnosus]|uniref:Uncharacterized protein n=1 Tax=Didymodactylos carnosus TaxID=1234261 RepID=A0A8S2FKP1_9BILA|nr:unnamed protein product [Didymodactylos carnosus]CAF4283856.1 unnamed protein product [Didymodactylos carnosus]
MSCFVNPKIMLCCCCFSEINPFDSTTDSNVEFISKNSNGKDLGESMNVNTSSHEQHIAHDIETITDVVLANNEKDVDSTKLSPAHRTSAAARCLTTGLLPSSQSQTSLSTSTSLTSPNHHNYHPTLPTQSPSSRFATHEELSASKHLSQHSSTKQHSTNRLSTVQQIQQLLTTTSARQILHSTILQQIADTRQHNPMILNNLLQGTQQHTNNSTMTASRRLLTNTSTSTSSSITTSSSTSARSLNDHDTEKLLLLLQKLRS